MGVTSQLKVYLGIYLHQNQQVKAPHSNISKIVALSSAKYKVKKDGGEIRIKQTHIGTWV